MEAVPGSEPRVLGRDIGASLTRALMDLASVRSAPPRARAQPTASLPAWRWAPWLAFGVRCWRAYGTRVAP